MFVPEVDRLLLADVSITTHRPEWRFIVGWDLMTVALALLDIDSPHGGSTYQSEVSRVLRDREDLRERVVPLYNQWRTAIIAAEQTEPANTRDALRRSLELQRLEADLHAVTAGSFKANIWRP